MRAKTEITDGRIIKTVETTPLVFENMKSKLKDYQDWLNESGFSIPDTQISYEKGVLTFNQEYIPSKQTIDPIEVIKKLSKLDFQMFGVDANPDNFVGDYFVDFYPFLVKDRAILKDQFDYDVYEVIQRYFTLENVLVAYVNRLFKKNRETAFVALHWINKIIDVDSALLREKVRLVSATVCRDEKEFARVYEHTKAIDSF